MNGLVKNRYSRMDYTIRETDMFGTGMQGYSLFRKYVCVQRVVW